MVGVKGRSGSSVGSREMDPAEKYYQMTVVDIDDDDDDEEEENGLKVRGGVNFDL